MSKRQFITRLLVFILGITSFLITMLLLLMIPVAGLSNPLYAPLIAIAVAVPLVSGYIVIVYLTFARPLADFLQDAEHGVMPDGPRLAKLQNRAVNLPNILGISAMPPYIIGAPIAAWIMIRHINLGPEYMSMACISGVLTAINALVMHSYFGLWVTTPILKMMAQGLKTGSSRAAGFKISVRTKLVATTISLVITTAGFIGIVSYLQLKEAVGNMEKLESWLPDSARARLSQAQLNPVEKTDDQAPRSSQAFRDAMANADYSYIMLLVLSLILAVALAVSAASSITRPLQELRSSAQMVTRGKYDDPVQLLTNDELADLGASINQMLATITGQIESMEAVLASLRQGILQMDQTANAVMEVSGEQSTGATEQASAVSETSSIAQDLLAMAKQISSHAGMVDKEASGTLTACRAGEEKLALAQEGFRGISEQVKAVEKAMENLENRFRYTFKIVELIQEIAEQTELLGLNASLEAAGAGAYGRRFAVVAEATSTLANRAVAATREIKDIVEAIQEATQHSTRIAEEGRMRVERGGQAMDSVSEALHTISSLAESTSHEARNIMVSTADQTQGIEQLAISVEQVNQVARRVEQGARRIESEIQLLRGFSESMRTVENPR